MKPFLTAIATMTVACCALSQARDSVESAVGFIPWPQNLEISGGTFELKPQSRIVHTCAELEPLAKILRQEIYQITSTLHEVTDAEAELKALVAFADAHGVTLITEFDAPGHTTAMRQAMPELFGQPDLSVINLGSEAVHGTLDKIVGEMCGIFASSPYFHIGADEANFGVLARDKIALLAIKDKGYDGVHDLFLDYVVRMNAAVKKHGKQTIMWESFAGTGSRKLTIPKDILVVAWETLYQQPQSLLDNGYTIISASWKPLYLTPGRRWNPDYVYGWNLFRWKNHWQAAPSYHPIQLAPQPNDRLLGGMMRSWESPDEMEIPGLRLRLAPYCERIWSPNGKLPYSHFVARFQKTDRLLQQLIAPVNFEAKGLTDPD